MRTSIIAVFLIISFQLFSQAPTITQHPSNSTVCEGGNTSFSVTATGTITGYQWQVSTDNGTTWYDISVAGSNPTYAGWTSNTLTINSITNAINSYIYRCIVLGQNGIQTNNYSTVGTQQWTCPSDVTSITVECRGGGGGSGSVSNFTGSAGYRSGGSGGGGAFAKSVVAVVPGTDYQVVVGGGGAAGGGSLYSLTPGGVGGSTVFGNNIVLALGGGGGASSTTGYGNAGIAGSATSSIGEVKFSGGSGVRNTTNDGLSRHGGGGGAGDISNGGNGSISTAGGQGAGGVNGGGTGGYYNPSATYINAVAPGGGAGSSMCYCPNGGFMSGQPGAKGSLKITYNIPANIISENALLSVSPKPSAAGAISGNATVCQGQSSVVYTVPSITNATSYTWTLPTGANGTSTTNSITVSYGTSAVSGNITVKGNNTCGSGTVSTLAITVNPLPVAAGTITGTTTVCQGQSSVTYTVPAITNATSYTWTLPTGATGTSTTNSITVSYGTSAVSGNITVKGINACGSGTVSTRAITVNPLPVAAGIITGNAIVCKGQNSVIYTVPAIANATSYVWSLPSGATGTSTTNSITVNFGTSSTSGNITVKGHNTCGDGAVSTKAITVNDVPSAAGTILGDVTVCQGQNFVTYTVPTISNATSYFWSLPTGATGTSTTNSITVSYGTSAVSGSITVKGNNSCGDGDISSLNINVKAITTSTITKTVCDSYTSPDGQIYTSSGVKTAIIPNVAGCDSIITINLTVNHSTSSSINETACESYTAPDGQIYTTSGIKTAVISNSVGCDSTITINLTINHNTFATQSETSCDSYFWPVNSQTYTSSGTYTGAIPNVVGCDSIITLNLVINNSSFAPDEDITACDNYLWSINGQTYSTSGVYYDTTANNVGCDSIRTLNLTINSVTILVQPSDQSVNLGDNTQFVVSTTSPSPTYQWQSDLGSGFQNIANTGQYSGVTTNTLTVSNAAMVNNNQQFRCIISSTTCSDTTSAATLTVIDDTGIDDGLSSEIKIYPNPFSNELIFESTNNSNKISFEIRNSIGQKVYCGNVTDKTIVPTTDFAPGVYVIKLDNGRIIEFKKIVKE